MEPVITLSLNEAIAVTLIARGDVDETNFLFHNRTLRTAIAVAMANAAEPVDFDLLRDVEEVDDILDRALYAGRGDAPLVFSDERA